MNLARLDLIIQYNHSNTEIRANCKTELKKRGSSFDGNFNGVVKHPTPTLLESGQKRSKNPRKMLKKNPNPNPQKTQHQTLSKLKD